MIVDNQVPANPHEFTYVAPLPPEIEGLRRELKGDAQRVSRLYNTVGILIVLSSAVATLLTSLSASNDDHALRYSAAIATAIAGIFSGVSTFFKLPQELARRWAATKYLDDACRRYMWGVFKAGDRVRELAHAVTTAERIVGGDVEKVAITEGGALPDDDDGVSGKEQAGKPSP